MSDIKQVALRIEEGFHNQIAKLAKEQHRSIHAQVVFMLQAYFDPQMLRNRLAELERAVTD